MKKYKIAIADNNGLKFSRDLKEHWEAQGHEVKYERGTSEHLAQWADIYYIDWADNNLAYLFKLYHESTEVSRPDNWDNNKKPMVVCRIIDWEVWTLAMHRDASMVSWVDKWICIAPHMEKKLREEASFGDSLRLIRPGVATGRFPLKTAKTDGFQLGMALGDMWWPKAHMAGLDIFTQLYRKNNRWKLHIRGQHEGGDYWPIMYKHYLESRGIEDVVTLYPHVEDMNAWYEQIDILLHPGMKETFCYAVGEAMAKGIPAVVNEFYGSRDIWVETMLYQTHQEAVDWIDNVNKHRINNQPRIGWPKLREYIEKEYSLEKQLKETDEWIGIK